MSSENALSKRPTPEEYVQMIRDATAQIKRDKAALIEAERLLLEVYEQDMEYAPPKPDGGREGVLQRIHAFLDQPVGGDER